jgi:hypothetical protein
MCQINILPIAIRVEDMDNELIRLAHILNKWFRILSKYGKIDGHTFNNDFTAIAKVVRKRRVDARLRKSVLLCRDYALTKNFAKLMELLPDTLKALRDNQEAPMIKQVRATHKNNGMTERYKPLSHRLYREHVRKLNKDLRFADVELENAKSAKLVRRIVEKRAAQQVHHNCRGEHDGNRFRQSVRRAKSFSLYCCSQCESNSLRRESGSHWKIAIDPETGEQRLTRKHSYGSYEEAIEACHTFTTNHPESQLPMHAYQCKCCNYWHIGHSRFAKPELLNENINKFSNDIIKNNLLSQTGTLNRLMS